LKWVYMTEEIKKKRRIGKEKTEERKTLNSEQTNITSEKTEEKEG